MAYADDLITYITPALADLAESPTPQETTRRTAKVESAIVTFVAVTAPPTQVGVAPPPAVDGNVPVALVTAVLRLVGAAYMDAIAPSVATAAAHQSALDAVSSLLPVPPAADALVLPAAVDPEALATATAAVASLTAELAAANAALATAQAAAASDDSVLAQIKALVEVAR